jgi:hypothetical protein
MKLRRITIECNDDGTYQVEAETEKKREKKDGDKEGMVSMGMDYDRKKFTINELSELSAKISKFTGEGKEEKDSGMNRFFNGPDKEEKIAEDY